MSTSTVACYQFAAPTLKRPARKIASQSLFVAAATSVLGCGWMVYANIFAASPYPELGAATFDAPVVRRFTSIAVRPVARPEPPTVAAPETAEAEPALSFVDRFAAASPQGVEPAPIPQEPPTKVAVAPKPEPLKLAEAPKAREPVRETRESSKESGRDGSKFQLASAPPAAQPEDQPKGLSKFGEMAQRAKNAIFSIASGDRHSIVEKLWGKEGSRNPVLAYASADAGSVTGSITREQNPMLGGSPPYDRDTAVYDIVAHTVYLPDGTKLEAHSGLGSNLDDPHSARIRMRGVTPPHIYTLKPRESLFHGVAALRLTPIGGEQAIYGREGLLAHSFMLGANGDSNGCVSFRDYSAFLSAYHNMGIRKLAVVTHVE
jgi:type VI secretion system (T6SS) effector TldE1-like protein